MKRIYLDNSATTPLCAEALAAYTAVATESYGNPSSRHRMGQEALRILQEAEKEVLLALGAKDGRVIFTSGGTEGNNLALFGRAFAKERFARGGKILTTRGEHASVNAPLASLAARGFQTVDIGTAGGVLDLEGLAAAADEKVFLASLMAANNETGALYDIAAASDILRAGCPDAALHVDATQSFMKHPFTVKSLGADMVTVSSHKVEGPKGVGALWVSGALLKKRGLSPILLGGGQQDGLRSGTENVPGIAGFAAALRVWREKGEERRCRVASLRAVLLEGLQREELRDSVLPLLPPVFLDNILNIEVKGIRSETVLNDLSGRGIFVSAGSACSSHDAHLSPALLAYGKTKDGADSSVRVSLSYRNTEEDIEALLCALADIVKSRQKKR